MQKKVFIYLKVSKPSLLHVQEQVLTKYCTQNDWQVVKASTDQEEMLEAYLTESEDFPELFSHCNIIYNILPYVMKEYEQSGRSERLSRKLSAIAVVASGYGGDIDTDTAYDLLDDMDFNKFGKVVCPEIERMLPCLNQMVEEQIDFNL